MDVDDLRTLFAAFPGVEEAPSYGTPGFRVRKKLLARLHQSEPAVVLRVEDVEQQEALIAMDPKTFYITDHYQGYPYVLARLRAKSRKRILEVFESSWRSAAPRKLVAEFDEGA